jgi:hypothetical protein
MNVLTAAIAAKRRISPMTNSTTPAPVDAPAKDTGHLVTATKTARATQSRTHLAPPRAKAARQATLTRPSGKSKSPLAAARAGSKTAKILDLLKRPGGASLKELTKATGWQAHSVRGFISGALRKKMGLRVRSFQRRDGERAYAVSSK